MYKLYGIMGIIRLMNCFSTIILLAGLTPASASAQSHDCDYKIITGQLEMGSDEEKEAFVQLFGDRNTQEKFDFYFHWYNIAHEYGHCILDFQGKSTGKVEEEIMVNKFAVSFWRAAGFTDELSKLKSMLEKRLATIPDPVPESCEFISWYNDIWGSDLLISVPVYGYLQFKSILIAMEEAEDLPSWFDKTGIDGFSEPECTKFERYPLKADSSAKYLNDIQSYLMKTGIGIPTAEIELTESPSTHCSQKISFD